MLRCPTCRALHADDLEVCPRDGAELEEASDSRLGLIIEGDIVLQEIAGGGAMGSVFEGWQAAMERPVAVKMLHRDLSRDAVFVERFLREARAIARLNHPNIVTIHAVGRAADSHYIVMEMIDGETLSDHIEHGPISDMRTIRITRQIASALADAHAAGIIHRDLKPANVLLSQRRRAADFVKILDFGVAKIVDADSALTRDGFVFGTPAYLSPEQANGVDIDGRSDLYSIGVMMFEMLSGGLPFKGNQVQLLLAHARDRAPALRDRAPQVDADLASLVDRLLEKDPDRRPASAEAFADELDSLLGDGEASPWASRALRASGSLDTADDAGLSGSALLVTSDWEGRRPRRRAETPETALSTPTAKQRHEPAQRPLWTIALLVFSGVALLGAGASAAAFGPLRAQLPMWPIEIKVARQPAAPAGAGDAEVEPAADVRNDVPSVALMLSQDGYSLRIIHPERPVIAELYDINIDVWGPDAEPIDLDKIAVTLRGPGFEQRSDAFAGEKRGGYVVRRRYTVAGEHTLVIYLPGADNPVQAHFEVIAR